MTSYKGLYVQRLEDGTIFGVQVADSSGNSISLLPQTYIEREVCPPIESLPDQANYQS